MKKNKNNPLCLLFLPGYTWDARLNNAKTEIEKNLEADCFSFLKTLPELESLHLWEEIC